jgi:hypothetical protein
LSTHRSKSKHAVERSYIIPKKSTPSIKTMIQIMQTTQKTFIRRNFDTPWLQHNPNFGFAGLVFLGIRSSYHIIAPQSPHIHSGCPTLKYSEFKVAGKKNKRLSIEIC